VPVRLGATSRALPAGLDVRERRRHLHAKLAQALGALDRRFPRRARVRLGAEPGAQSLHLLGARPRLDRLAREQTGERDEEHGLLQYTLAQMAHDESEVDRGYRALIDRLVDECRSGQGQIMPRRAREGVWNRNATPESEPEDDEANRLLARMSNAEREVIARMLQQEFVGGVHTTLVALHEAEMAPFDRAYEGTPFHDFVGRLDDWEWPSGRARS
jgi:hypothetical protein